ncbi:UvrD-helicase domain-containing protein [Tistrella bauzanensis]
MHLLLDEAQDTSPEQWTVVERLTEEFFAGDGNPHDQAGHDADGLPLARTVFAVGDPKQSIYRFQRADPEGFRRMQAFFQARVSAAERGWSVVALRQSFRSVAAVLAAVDAVFATAPPAMAWWSQARCCVMKPPGSVRPGSWSCGRWRWRKSATPMMSGWCPRCASPKMIRWRGWPMPSPAPFAAGWTGPRC